MRRSRSIGGIHRVFRLRHRNVIAWLLLAAFWLQAVAVPVELAQAQVLGTLSGDQAFPICAAHAGDHGDQPGVPSKLHHHAHPCCLTGGCIGWHPYAAPSPIRWVMPTTARCAAYGLTAAAPRAPPQGSRPFTTGPPAFS